MSPRPRTTPDESVLAAAERALARFGPGRLTLADVAAEAGLAPATLLQRFGSKRGLLLALQAGRIDQVAREFATAAPQESPSEALLAALVRLAGESTPDALAHRLAFLHGELGDAEFQALARDEALRMREGICRLLEAAVAAGELETEDADGLAQTVQTSYAGALASWTVFRVGELDAWLRGEIEAVLEPYRAE